MNYSGDRGSSIGEALLCFIPVLGWLHCLSSCTPAGDEEPKMIIQEGGGVFDSPPPADAKTNSADGFSGADTSNDVSNDSRESVKADADVGKEVKSSPDAGDEISEPPDAEESPDNGDVSFAEFPNYDAPPAAEDTWQSTYESLGLCYNPFSTCKLVTSSPCWYINKINGFKPDTLTFLDPSLASIELEIVSGASDNIWIYEFIRESESDEMIGKYFASTIWTSGDLLIAADYVGDTVDILFSMPGVDADGGVCEYDHNYPCPGEDVCNP